MVYVKTIFIFFMELSRNFNGAVSMENDFRSKQIDSCLFATNVFVLCMEHRQCFQAITIIFFCCKSPRVPETLF